MSNLSDAFSAFTNEISASGLHDEYYYPLILGMSFSKMERIMKQEDVIKEIKKRLSRAYNIPPDYFADIKLSRGCLKVDFSFKGKKRIYFTGGL